MAASTSRSNWIFSALHRAERDAAVARFRSAEFDRDAVLLAVQTDVARAFVQQATLAARLDLVDRNITQQRELERIIRARVDAGEGTRVDLGLQTIQVRELQSERSRLEEALGRTRTSLAVLVGEEAPQFRHSPAALESLVVPSLRPVQPTELVARRPDVHAAEARIQAAGGDVRAARAAFYPRLTLSSRGLSQAAILGGPLSTLFSTGAGLLAPIFDRGRLRGNLEFAGGQQAESVALYRQALLNCLADAENAISAVNRSGERAEITEQIVTHARETARLARIQYLEGDTDLQRLFDAEQRLIESEDARLITRAGAARGGHRSVQGHGRDAGPTLTFVEEMRQPRGHVRPSATAGMCGTCPKNGLAAFGHVPPFGFAPMSAP